MGAWGTGILQDDFTLDVYGDYLTNLDEGKTHAEVRATLEADYADDLDDSEDGLLFWLALAKAQWDCGALQADVLARVEIIVAEGEIDRGWLDPANYRRRRGALIRFLKTIQTPRAAHRVRRPRRIRVS